MIAKPKCKPQESILNLKINSRKAVDGLTVNSPVTASKPTWTVCSKFVGYEIFGLESMCDGLEPFILFFNVFFLRSASSGSLSESKE